MIGISNYDSNSIHTLFSGLSNGNRTSNSGLLGINIVDYSAIRTGSYFKLMKAYYGGKSTAKSLVNSSATTTASDKINAVSVRDKAAALNDSATKLFAKLP